MKIIFLDIDGVLVTCLTILENRKNGSCGDQYGDFFGEKQTQNLRHIIESTNADIVITSTLRIDGIVKIIEMWKDRNMPGRIIGITPHNSNRGLEIKQWIGHKKIDNYVIIDDEDEFDNDQKEHYIQTHLAKGLTSNDANTAINILKS